MKSSSIILFLKENKLWIAKAAFILFAVISVIVYFADFYNSIYHKFPSCHEIHPLFICLGVIALLFTVCSLVIILVQYHRHYRGQKYIHLGDKDEDGSTASMYALDHNMMSSKLRTVLKWCSHIFTFILSLILVAIMITYASFGSATLPKINGDMVLSGLIADTTIQREPDGVIHIKASNVHDMYFAQGVAMAQERLWQMEFNRRVGNGTLSAVLGNATLSTDIMFRTLGFYHASVAAVAALSEDALSAVNAYVEGVNSYLGTKPPLSVEFHLLGYEPQPFTNVDAMLMVKILALELAGNFFAEVNYFELMHKQNLTLAQVCELKPDYPPNAPTILDDEDIKHINFTHQFQPIDFKRTIPSTETSSKHSQRNSVQGGPKINPRDLIKESGVIKGFDFGFTYHSNNWVVGSNRTQSGKPLLCNDPHLNINAPAIWLLMHLECPTVSVIGATPVGAPGITIGRNADIAWGVTNTYIDVQDLYLLELNEAGTSYFHNNTWLDFEYRTEVISIKGLKDYTVTVPECLYGPVVTDIVDFEGQTGALHWTSLADNDTTFDAIVQLSTAKNFDDFRNALRSYVGPSQNFIYADTQGNIGYQAPGKVPFRVPGHSGMIPVPGNGSYDWIGWIPFDELPWVYNPSKGYIVTANNKITPPSYPYLLLNNHDWEEHYRALRITTLVNSTNHHTVSTMGSIQYDTVTGVWADLKPFVSTIPDSMLDDKSKVWKNKLLSWDGNETPESEQATVFEFWVYYLGRMGSAAGVYSWSVPYYLENTLKNITMSPVCGGDCLHFVASSFVSAVHSANNRKWGDVHHLFIDHQVMSQTPVACLFDMEAKTGGSSYTVNLGAINVINEENVNNPFNSYAGPSYRQIVDLSNMENSVFVIPTGNSGNILDENYNSMLKSFLAGEYYPMKMNNYEVDHTLKLK